MLFESYNMKIGSLALIITILTSCGDCIQNIRGKIVDNNSLEPIDSVKIQKENRTEQFTFTDKQGDFELSSISGGLFSCPPMKVIITKEGYDTVKAAIELNRTQTIRLIKKQ